VKIQLKRSNVLSNGKAKEPTPTNMEYGEIAVNYNAQDPTLFIKDSSNAIVAITGDNSELEAEIEAIKDIISVLPSPLDGPEFQPDTLDERYISRFSWSDLPAFSTAP